MGKIYLRIRASLPGLLKEKALRLIGEFRSSQIFAPTGTGALQMAPDPDQPNAYSCI